MTRLATITVIGKDRSGVIARFTGLLFELGANIEALEEQVRRGQFSMTVQASWHRTTLNEAEVGSALLKLGRDISMEVNIRFMDKRTRPRMAILTTREPHCLEALLKAKLPCDCVLVAGNYPSLDPIARKAGVPFLHVPWDNRVEAENLLLKRLDEMQADFIVLARFMKILSPNFVWRWKHKIINIHPSLLPAFPGANAYRQAFERGVRVAGVTAHLVTPDLDEGPILWQESFRVTPHMALPDVVTAGQKLESKALVKAVRLFLTRRFDIYWGKIHEPEN